MLTKLAEKMICSLAKLVGIFTQISELEEMEFPIRFVKPKIVFPRPNSKVPANGFITLHAATFRFEDGDK